ncbi:MAG TPA: MFS transporter [Actinomycetota bacterium]|jgi:MFS family permease|nr:MFS transporter [Actinomycetota bacterium]
MAVSYLALLGRPGARRLLGALVGAWLSFGMVGLAVFLAVHRASGSASLAGVAVAAFSIGSGALAPARGRLLDRRGVRPWLVLLASGYATWLLALMVAAHAHAPGWWLAVCAGGAGSSAPPLIASIRPQWAQVVDATLVRRAYALMSLLGDVGLVAAPALGGLLFAAAAWSPLAGCAVAALAAAVVAAHHAPAAGPSGGPHADRSPLASTAMRVLLGVSVALGAALGLVEVAVLAAATRWDVTAYAGLLLGTFALGSVTGGLWFGRRHWQRPPQERYLLAVLVLALAVAPPLLARNAVVLAPLLLVAGVGYGPGTISLFEALDVLAPGKGAEALTWVTTAEALGTATGAATAGAASVRLGTWAPFAIASVVLAVPAAAALLWQRATVQAPNINPR